MGKGKVKVMGTGKGKETGKDLGRDSVMGLVMDLGKGWWC